MAATLFDHIKQITDVQNPKYWDTLDESDKKKWSNYMVLRFLSMNTDWVAMVAELQPYLQELPPKVFYLALIDLIPKSRTFLKYMKPATSEKYEKWIVELVSKYYEVSELEAEEYVDILYAIKGGHQTLNNIAESYGTDPKIIKKLKLKL
jgi:hypothetical protein